MNCAECQTEPLTPGHYCPCCGRKLSLQEQRTLKAASPAARCQSCGGVSADGDLCKTCRQAFAPLLDGARVSEAKAAAVDKTTEVALPPPVVKVDAVKMEAAKAETAKAVADLTAKAHLARAANPAPVTRRPVVSVPPIVPVPPQRRRRTTVLIAAAVVVVAIGAAEGARRLGFQWPPQVAREGPSVLATPSPTRTAAIAPAQTAAPPKPRTAVPTRPPALAALVSPRVPAPPAGRFFERNDVDELPRIATRVEPKLPANIPARRHNDIAVVRVLVSRTGHPLRVSLLRGSKRGRSSDEAVVAAVRQWTFSPAKKRGETVNCWYNIGVPLG